MARGRWGRAGCDRADGCACGVCDPHVVHARATWEFFFLVFGLTLAPLHPLLLLPLPLSPVPFARCVCFQPPSRKAFSSPSGRRSTARLSSTPSRASTSDWTCSRGRRRWTAPRSVVRTHTAPLGEMGRWAAAGRAGAGAGWRGGSARLGSSIAIAGPLTLTRTRTRTRSSFPTLLLVRAHRHRPPCPPILPHLPHPRAEYLIRKPHLIVSNGDPVDARPANSWNFDAGDLSTFALVNQNYFDRADGVLGVCMKEQRCDPRSRHTRAVQLQARGETDGWCTALPRRVCMQARQSGSKSEAIAGRTAWPMRPPAGLVFADVVAKPCRHAFFSGDSVPVSCQRRDPQLPRRAPDRVRVARVGPGRRRGGRGRQRARRHRRRRAHHRTGFQGRTNGPGWN